MAHMKSDKEEQNKKLFIGGLNPKTDEDTLKNFYLQWGAITDVVVMKDPKSGKSRGFGFVTYADSASVDMAQKNRPHEIDAKVVDTKRAMPKNHSNPTIHSSVNKIFVGGLKKEIDEEDLKEYFSQFGSISQAAVVRDKETNESKKFGFVTFDDNDSVDKIILCCPHTIKDTKVDVNKAVSKNEMREMKDKTMRQLPHQIYGAGAYGAYGAYDPYGHPGYGYGGGYGGGYAAGYEGGYGYEDWSGYGGGQDFGSYGAQGYAGGPMKPSRGQNFQRPAPYQQGQHAPAKGGPPQASNAPNPNAAYPES